MIDGYKNTFKGTFTFARYGYKVTPPPPKDPGGSGVSAINGAWQGEFVLLYNPDVGRKRTPLTLDLKQQGANIVGTARFGDTPAKVIGTIAGSAFTLVLGDSSGRMKIEGEFTKDAMVGKAIIYYGDQDEKASAFGEVNLSR